MTKLKYIFVLLLLHAAASGQQVRFQSYTTKDGLSNNYVESIAQDRSGYLWVATRMGLNRFNGREFRHFFMDVRDSTSLPFNNILTLFVDANNTLWLGSYGSQIASYDQTSERFTKYEFDGLVDGANTDVFEIYASVGNSIAIRTQNGTFTLAGGRFVRDPQSPVRQPAAHTAVTAAGKVWRATSNGIACTTASGTTTVYTTENSPELRSNSFSTVFKDRGGNLWFGSHSGGLVMLALRADPLQFYSSANLPLRGNITTSFHTDADGHRWVASDGGGIAVFDAQYRLIRHIDIPGIGKSFSALDFADGGDGWLWVACWKDGVFAVNTKTYAVRLFAGQFSRSGISNNVKAVAVRGDTVFCGTYGDGLVIINRKSGTVISHTSVTRNAFMQVPTFINDILADSGGNVWLASTRGLFNYTDGVMLPVVIDKSDAQNSAKNMVWSVREDARRRILVATSYCGYVKEVNGDGFAEIHIGRTPPYDVKFIFADSKHRVWLGAFDDLYLIEGNEPAASIKLSQSEFSVDLFVAGAVLQDTSGLLYIGTQDGFYAFVPDSLTIKETAPAILFQSLSRKYVTQLPGNSSILHKHINDCAYINLRYDDFPLSLSFASIVYDQQASIAFAYKVENLDTAWMPVPANNELVFHQLKPGTYRLLLRNTNRYGKWSTESRRLDIVVAPPLWQTWWFRAVVALALAAGVVLAFRIRVKRLRLQKIVLQREVAAQTQTLRLQNDEINAQKSKLELQADELQEKLLQLYDQQEDLEALNAELSEQSEETSAANSQLVSALNTKNKLLSIIAHDAKNPFSVILSGTELLLNKLNGAADKEYVKYAQRIDAASKSVFGILSSLLDWAMAQSGMLTSNPKNLSVASFIASVTDDSRELVAQKNIRLAVQCDDSLWCFADEQMMRIVLRNLLQNAVKFTPEGGLLSILCADDGDKVKIEIIDTGVGMDAQTMERLFDVNAVISEKGTNNEDGRGLGLLVVKEFVEKNNGSVTVQSKKNKGSSFTVRLPRGVQGEAPVESPRLPYAEPSVQVAKNDEITVLLVDDNAKLLEQLARSVGERYRVEACSNAHGAIEVCKSMPVDIIISDIVMDSIDGITLCETIKRDLGMDIPVVLITGMDSPEVQMKAYDSGVDAFIRKPFELGVLLSRIDNLLKTHRTDATKGFRLASKLKPHDEQFAEQLKLEVEKGISDAEFSVEQLAQNMGCSRANLFRKAKKVLGITPSEYIQCARLEVAANLLKEKKYRVAEVAYMVGFSNPQYFSNCFMKHFGMSPGEYKSR